MGLSQLRLAYLGLLLLLLGLAACAGSQGSEGPEFDLPTRSYETKDYREPPALGALFGMARNFIHVVLPRPFPADVIRELLQKKTFDYKTDSRSVVIYELGVIFCVVLGLLFVVLMPLVGLCFGLCRCCNKCGGEMHQRQKKNGPFLRKCFAVSLWVTCLFISFGILCGFLANQRLSRQIQGTQKLINSSINDMRMLVNQTPVQITYALDQFQTTKTRVFSELDDIKSLLGGGIQEKLRPSVNPVLNEVVAIAEAMKKSRDILVDVNKVLGEQQASSAQLHTSLADLKQSIESSISDPVCSQPAGAGVCKNIRQSLGQLGSHANLNQLPALDKHINSINDVLQIDLLSLVRKGNKTINDIPEMVQKQTTNIIAGVKNTLNSIGSKIDDISRQIPSHSSLSTVLDYINEAENEVNRYLPEVEKYDLYRWLGGLMICLVLTLVVVFYCLGLLCGTVGYDPKATPARRGCVSNLGGVLLMVGVGTSFLFCWIIMVIVTLTFAVGGNVEKLVCEPYQNRKLFQLLDTPYLINKEWRYYLSGMLLRNPDIPLTFEQVYSDCKNRRGIYGALKLEHVYNISEHLDIQKYTKSINDRFETMQISIDPIVLLDQAGRKSLEDFISSGIDKIDFGVYLAETSKTPVKVALSSYASELDAKARSLPPGNLKDSLQKHVQTLRAIQRDQVISLQQKMQSVHQSMKELQRETSGLKVKVNNILAGLDSVQDFIANRISSIIKEESEKYVETTILGSFKRYLRWLKHAFTEKIASCKPMATVLDSAVDVILCSYMFDPVNLFWFGVGKATFLLLPALIFAVKLAKYYRRMDSEDVYDDFETALEKINPSDQTM